VTKEQLTPMALGVYPGCLLKKGLAMLNRFTFALGVAWVVFGLSAMAQEVSVAGDALPSENEAEEGTEYAAVPGYKCKDFGGCPEGVLLVNPNGTPYGCTAANFTGCEGDCFTCSDRPNFLVSLCSVDPEKICTVTAPYRKPYCGSILKHPAACYTSTGGTCMCNTTIGSINVGGCQIAECNGGF
jgi:hypothetical protein